MARDNEAIENLHVAAHTEEGSITMLYNVRPGACDRSYGIHVAEVVGFPPAVLEGAKRKVKEFESASFKATGSAATSGHSPTPPESKRAKLGADGEPQWTTTELARISAFVKEFRNMDKNDIRSGKAKSLIAQFRKEISESSATTEGLQTLLSQ